MSPPASPRVFLFACMVLVASVLPGCMQEEGEEKGDGTSGTHEVHDPLSPEQIAGLEPAWFPGLVYTYRLEHPPTGAGAVLDFVVLDGPGTDWTLDPVDEEEDQQEALAWALYWGLPVGAVDFEQYEPRRDGEPMDWFSFPLEESKRWEGTAPDGLGVTFQAEAAKLMLPDGQRAQGYRVTGAREGERLLEYTYTSEVGWFVSLWWDATGDGQAEVELELVGLEVKPVLTKRPLRSLERFVDLHLEGADLEELSIEQGRPLVTDAFEVPSPGNATYWLARYSKGTGAYQANVSFEQEPGWEAGGIPGESQSGFSWGRLTPEADEGEARLALLGEGEAHLAGLQLVPRAD